MSVLVITSRRERGSAFRVEFQIEECILPGSIHHRQPFFQVEVLFPLRVKWL